MGLDGDKTEALQEIFNFHDSLVEWGCCIMTSKSVLAHHSSSVESSKVRACLQELLTVYQNIHDAEKKLLHFVRSLPEEPMHVA